MTADSTRVRRVIELRGHILDSGIFQRVLETLMDTGGASYTIDEVLPGANVEETSYARLTVEAATPASLEKLLDHLREAGAVPVADSDAITEPAPADGILPDDFYATTNYVTEVRVKGEWRKVSRPEMDCAIVLEGALAHTVAPSDVRKDARVVVGHAGVKVDLPQRSRRRAIFEFMSSAVSSEKPKESLIVEIARELRRTLDEGKRVLVVGGPAIVHTGAACYLADMIREGYVTALFAGNALALHDIEAQFFGTSLGVRLTDALLVDEGHVHHLRSVNRVRAVGGIRQAMELGLLKGGVMYEALRAGIPVVLAGSIRDDGPLPEVITDVIEAQREMRRYVPEIGMAIMVCTLLHSIAVGNLLPASCKTISVDINPASVTKLTDRGSTQTIGLVMDAAGFLRELRQACRGQVPEPG